MKEHNIKILESNPIFRGLTPESIQSLLPCITHKIQTYEKGEYIYHAGDSVTHLGVVLKGKLAVSRIDVDGKRVLVSMIEEGSFFGEAIIFATGGTVPHDVCADSQTTVVYFTSDFFIRSCVQGCRQEYLHSVVMKNMLRILSDRALLLSRKISYLSAPDLRSKIALYLIDLHDNNGTLIFQTPLNRDELAEFLAVARPSLSREFSNLKKDGIIDYYRSSIKILDKSALQELAKSCR